jgi:dipeptidyl aminopeptidase/acylaminoacyl peptidase
MKRCVALVIAAFAMLFWIRFRPGAVTANTADPTTWGATDPTWSPDGKKLAFSLFGSIWQVDADGGIAEQITASEGYHAHPAWSPQGDRIAFVNGNPPAGPIPNISGALSVAELSAGAERRVATPHPVAGTLAWSREGSSIACGLRTPNAGSLLHEIRLPDGRAEALQVMPAARPVSGWLDAAWHPNGREIFFAGVRGGAPQIWSLRAGRPPIQIQLPLTSYRPQDIVLLHSISALKDGSGVVYSADVVNGRGNFELYRVPSNGGKPVPLTETDRDEFAPAVSPDGSRLAFVSNERGNIDLFTMPVSGGERKHVRITSLKFRRPSGHVRLRINDEQGNPTAARVYVRAADGKGYAPAGAPIYYLTLDSGSPRQALFIAGGDDTFPAPAGKLTIVAVKGTEYDVAERTIDVAAGQTAELTIQLQRWTNWMQRGWYTGENHFHANYNGSYYQRPPDSLRWLQAEDLNAANMIVANSQGAFVHDKEFFTGGVSSLSTSRYVLYWGQEYRNDFVLGHMAFLNIKKQVPPSYTSVIGSDSPYDFPLNTTAAAAAKKQGGLVTYVHPHYGGVADPFDTYYGAKELPVSAALGVVDSMDILPSGESAYEMWYRLLNAGFKISAGAGTDCFTNWRGINRVPGSGRTYVEVGGVLTWDRWLDRYREGRNFVSNGPLVTFNVNGQPAGAEIRVPPGQPYRARISAEVISRVPLRRVEVIRNGEVIASADASAGERSLRIDHEASVDRSCWLAVRVVGGQARGLGAGDQVTRAHTTPVYVTVGGKPAVVGEDVELLIRWVDRLWALLEERNNFGPGNNRDQARRIFQQALEHYRQKRGASL